MVRGRVLAAIAGLSLSQAGAGVAGQASLFPGAPLAAARTPLIALGQAQGDAAPRRPGSLFAGQRGTSLFAPWPEGGAAPPGPSGADGLTAQAAQLRRLIALAEAGPLGYDAVQHGAAMPPPGPPTRLTLAQIDGWIDATPGQPHAIGRYQFIPKTLRRLVRRSGLGPATVFSPAVQDRLADVLLQEAGIAAFHEGRIGRQEFMHNLAKIWAGLPTATGRSYYHGIAGNRATMTWARFEAEMARIFPG